MNVEKQDVGVGGKDRLGPVAMVKFPSTIKTRSIPCSALAWRAATATLLIRQNPWSCFVVRLAATGKKTGRFDTLCADIEFKRRSAADPDTAGKPEIGRLYFLVWFQASNIVKMEDAGVGGT